MPENEPLRGIAGGLASLGAAELFDSGEFAGKEICSAEMSGCARVGVERGSVNVVAGNSKSRVLSQIEIERAAYGLHG